MWMSQCVATLGTTPSCAFDHLTEIGPVCKLNLTVFPCPSIKMCFEVQCGQIWCLSPNYCYFYALILQHYVISILKLLQATSMTSGCILMLLMPAPRLFVPSSAICWMELRYSCFQKHSLIMLFWQHWDQLSKFKYRFQIRVIRFYISFNVCLQIFLQFANSFNFNPHKWLQVNFDCSAMW